MILDIFVIFLFLVVAGSVYWFVIKKNPLPDFIKDLTKSKEKVEATPVPAIATTAVQSYSNVVLEPVPKLLQPTAPAVITQDETLAQAAAGRWGMDGSMIAALLTVAYTLEGDTNDEKIANFFALKNAPQDEAGWAKWRETFSKNKGTNPVVNDGIVPEIVPAVVGGQGYNEYPPLPEVFKSFRLPNAINAEEKKFNELMETQGPKAAYRYAVGHWGSMDLRKELTKAGADTGDIAKVINQSSNQGKYYAF